MVSPNASSAKDTGTVTCRSSPSRVKTLSGFTLTATKRSPAGVPLGPASPCPANRTFWPSMTPAGMRTVIERVRWTVPEPLQSVQGSSIFWPVPPHSVHGAEKAKAPRFSEENPVPLQFLHCEVLPDLEPEP